jgi:hypothetical protein
MPFWVFFSTKMSSIVEFLNGRKQQMIVVEVCYNFEIPEIGFKSIRSLRKWWRLI